MRSVWPEDGDIEQAAAATATSTTGKARGAVEVPSMIPEGASRALVQRKLMRRRAANTSNATTDDKQVQRKGGEAAGGGASETETAEQGFAGAPSAMPFRGELERGFGRSLGHVEVHTGPEAQSASRALGAEAYAYGNQIAFANDSPSREVVAHEVAHTIQQSGGSAVQTFSTGSSDLLEAEADAAAATVTGGGQAEIQLTTGPSSGVHKWGGADHYVLGNLAGQKALTRFHEMFGNRMPPGMATREADIVRGGGDTGDAMGGMRQEHGQTLAIPTGQGTSMSMGETARFGGDYAATPQDLRGRNQEGGSKASWNPLEWNKTAETASAVMIAATNSNHFYPLNRMEWAGHHAQAVALAAQGNMTAAMQQEGFAVHFLQDTFSSGHMAPRSLDSIPHMKAEADLTLGDARHGLTRTKTWHDFFCMLPTGLPTSRGRFHGDNYMDGNDLEVVSNTVRDSLTEVMAAGAGQPVNLAVASQVPTPDLGAILADPVAGPAWRLMQDSYREDMNEADKKVKKGETSTTGGGTTYDSRAVLDEIKANVMGVGPAPHAERPADRAGAVRDRKASLMGTLTNLGHYVTAQFDRQVFLHLDHDLEKSDSRSPHYKLGELESKFKFFSTAESQADRLIEGLREYSSEHGADRSLAEKEIASVQLIRQRIVEWRKLTEEEIAIALPIGGVKSLFPERMERYRERIQREALQSNDLLASLADVPAVHPPEQQHVEPGKPGTQ